MRSACWDIVAKKYGVLKIYNVPLRFRVTHHDKKHHGGPNPMVSSGDQLDQSQESEERKEGYNLRSMFKDARPPSESSNGVAQNVGKRRKSVTIFGLRRGSDPVGIKVGEGTARETGGVRFATQKQPVVLEELLQKENTEVTLKHGTKPGIKPETEPSKNHTCAPPHREDKIVGVVISPSSQTNVKASDSSPALETGSKPEPSLEPCTNLMIKPTTGRTAAFGGSSLPISSPASSRQIFKTMEKGEDIEDNMLKIDAYDPGPLQTSTPIAPMHGLISSFTPVNPADQPEPYSSTGFPVTQTPPNPSPDLEPDFGASLALISLGSSPPSSFQIKTVSSVSLLGTPTSPLAVSPSPNLGSRNTSSEATKSDFSPALTPSPKLPSGKAISSQSPTTYSSASPLKVCVLSPAPVASLKPDTMPVSPQTSSPADQNQAIESPQCLTLKAESVTSITSMTKGDMISSQLSLKEQELEGAPIPKSEGKTERKTAGILKTLQIPSPTDRLSKDRLSTLPLSPSSLTSPSSPIGNRVTNVTIVKASPDSKREFSVVTMVEEEESSTSLKEQKGKTSELGVESDKVGISSADSQGVKLSSSGVGPSESQCGETSGADDWPMIYQEKDDMVEMEDIRDCQVQQVEGADKMNEE